MLGAEAAARFLAGVPGEIALRPFAPSLGARPRVLGRDGAVFVERGGRRLDAAVLAAEVCADPSCELFMVQERVLPHERLRGLVPGTDGGLPLARLTTFVADDGAVRLLHACLILPGAGRGIAEVEPMTGVLGGPGTAPGDADRLPDWEEARALALRGALLLMPQRSIAWDIALSPDGPVVLGADSRYPRIASARFDEALRTMERALAPSGTAPGRRGS